MNATIVLGIPSKILGTIFGILEGYIIAFVIVFILSMASVSTTKVNESKYGNTLLENTPVLSAIVSDSYQAITEVYKICIDYENNDNKDEANLKSLKVLLKYDILSVDSADKLIEMKKLTTPGAKEIVDEYRLKS